MLKVILCITGLVLAALGAGSVYQGFQNSSPTVVTCADYARARPSALWLTVRGCEMDYLGAGYREADGTIQELFLPIRPAGAQPNEPAALVAATRDPAVLAIAQGGIGNGRQPNQEQFLLMMLKIVTALGASREMTGLVRTGFVERLRTRRVLSGLTTPLAPGVAVIDLNARPSLLVPVVQTVAGLVLLVTALRLRPARRPAPTPEAALPEVAAAVAETLPAVPDAVRLRGLLLLNLRPEQGREHIEFAPPLGEREETKRRIAESIVGLQFDARGRGHLRDQDFAVIVDIGPGDPVSSAVAGADGAAGVTAIRRLLTATGWRAYAPMTGRFIEPADLEMPAAQPLRRSG